MYAEERQQAIAGVVSREGRASVTGLAAELDVTTETVRRDLSALERLGLVRRVHGGAVPATSVTVLEAGLSERDVEQVEMKERIAVEAIKHLPNSGATLLLDAGTTTARLAARLPDDRTWTVITHSVPIAALLASRLCVDLHLLPGRVRTPTHAAVGTQTVEALHNLRADVLFLGTNGISADHGLSTPDPDEAATKRALVSSALHVVVLADSTKIGQERMVQFATLEEIDVLITDDQITTQDREMIEAAGVEVMIG